VSRGGIVLSSTDRGRAPFGGSAMMPGDSSSRCGTLTYQGISPAEIRLYATDVHATRGLASQMDVLVETGSSGGSAGCSAFHVSHVVFSGLMTTFPTGWLGSAPVLVTDRGLIRLDYRITYAMAADTPDSAQAGTAAMSLVWEARRPGT
jgi:hypothetical protein